MARWVKTESGYMAKADGHAAAIKRMEWNYSRASSRKTEWIVWFDGQFCGSMDTLAEAKSRAAVMFLRAG